MSDGNWQPCWRGECRTACAYANVCTEGRYASAPAPDQTGRYGVCASCEATPEACDFFGCCDDCLRHRGATHDRTKFDPHDHGDQPCSPDCSSFFAAPLTGPYTSKED